MNLKEWISKNETLLYVLDSHKVHREGELLPFACGENEDDGEVSAQAEAGGQGEEDDERDLERMAYGLQARVVEVLLCETGVSPRHVGEFFVIVQVRHPTLE